MRNVVQRSGRPAEEVKALAISSQGETLIAVDKDGAPLRKAIVWLDNRAVEEAGLIARQFGVEQAFHVTGQPDIAPTWPACKILWIKRNEPEVFARAAKFLLVEDYLLYRLTGQFVTEYSVQTSSLLVDIQNKVWWQPIFDFIGMSPDRMGRLLEPGDVVGPLSPAGAEAIGLSTRTIAVTGAMDQMIGAVGAGNIAPGVVTETTGVLWPSPSHWIIHSFDPQRHIPCYYHARRDRYCLLPWVQTAGMALKWFRDQFYGLETQVAQASHLDAYDLITRAAGQVPPGSDGLVVLPHLEGTSCPEFNPAARAVFFGATLRHTKAHFARGIMESVAYMLKKNLDLVEGLGINVAEIRSMGGGARSDLWLKIKADVLQKPVTAVEVEEAACLGAALTAAVATGSFVSLEEGVSHMVRLRETIQPDRDHYAAYQKGYAQYLELYERLAPMFV